jgi:hypothetical protein
MYFPAILTDHFSQWPHLSASNDHKIKVGTKCMILLCRQSDTLMQQWELVGTQWELVGTQWELSGNSVGTRSEYGRISYGLPREYVGS